MPCPSAVYVRAACAVRPVMTGALRAQPILSTQGGRGGLGVRASAGEACSPAPKPVVFRTARLRQGLRSEVRSPSGGPKSETSSALP